MGEAGEGALADDFGLEGDIPEELADAGAEGVEVEPRVGAGGEDIVENTAESDRKQDERGSEEPAKQESFDPGRVRHYRKIVS
jgi:hypothetical protein